MKIEIIIPAYNCIDTLTTTLGSLVAQTDKDFNVHLIDDCSSQDLSPVINQFKNLLNIKVTRNQENKGCGMSRQVGIDATDADYIAFLDSDDALMPYAIETWRAMIISNPEIDIFHSYFYEQGISKDGKFLLNLVQKGFTWMHGKIYKTSFIKYWGIRNSPEVKWADDSFFNSMCSELGTMGLIPVPMYCWLNNQNSVTRNGSMRMSKGIIDFAHAMKLSIEFVRSKGLKKIQHLPNTIKLIESKKEEYCSQSGEREYQELMDFLYHNLKEQE